MSRKGTFAKGRRRAPAARSRSARGRAATRGSHRVAGPLLIRDIRARANELRQALRAGARDFDLGGVTAIDTAGVQLLLALTAEGARRGQLVSLCGCATVVIEAARSLGLATRLALTLEPA